MTGVYDVLMPAGSPCPGCGAPIERRRASADPAETLMRCRRCGWSSTYRKPGSPPREGSPAASCDDLNWLMGRDPAPRRAEILELGR